MSAANPLGSWELPEELRMLRDTTRRFMDNEVKPAEASEPHDSYALPEEKLRPLQEKAKALGLWCVQTPAEYGGAGLNLLGQCIVAEESAKCKMGAYIAACGAFGFDPPNIIFKGRKDQIEKYALPTIRDGDKTFVAITEPSGGSDPGRAIRTRAQRKGDRYIINGSKIFITGVGQSKWGVVFARTGGPGRGGVSAFIVERDKPGLRWSPFPVIRSYSPYELSFEDYEVPAENMLGEEGKGFSFAEEWLVHERAPYAAATIGLGQAALDMAIEWALQRETFGGLLSDRQAIQWMLADSEIELRAARLLVYEAAWQADRGQDSKLAASVAKVYGTETAGRVVDRCIQIFGGMGVSKELPLERWYRELRIKRIGEGPSEVHRMVVARNLLGGRRSAR
ncbi:MAG: acyl-CoA dehydrogenase [Betaproteobacteria bacterium]|nr:acyl-CoA dehydrogenase [Betaproteobacteria bacterium]